MPPYFFKLHTLGYLRSKELAELHTKLHFRSEYTSLLLCTEVRSRGKWNTLIDASFCVAKEAASVLPNQRLQNAEDFKDINFILHLSYLSDILGVINHCNWPGTLEA